MIGIIFSLVSANSFAADIQRESQHWTEIYKEYQPVNLSEDEIPPEELIKRAKNGSPIPEKLLQEIVLFDFERETGDFFAESNIEGIYLTEPGFSLGLLPSDPMISIGEARDGNYSLKLRVTQSTCDLKIPIDFGSINASKYNLGFSTKTTDHSMGGVILEVSLLDENKNTIVHSERNLYDLPPEWRDHWTYLGNIPNVEEATYIRLYYDARKSIYGDPDQLYLDKFLLEPLSEEEIYSLQQESLKTLAKISDVAETSQPKEEKHWTRKIPVLGRIIDYIFG